MGYGSLINGQYPILSPVFRNKEVFGDYAMVPVILIAAALAIAVFTDIRSHRIPNWLVASIAVLSLAWQALTGGMHGVLLGAEGLAVGFSFFIVPYLMGGTGGGDLKLMTAVGCFLGPRGTLHSVILTFLVGGVYGVAVLLIRREYVRNTLKRYWSILSTYLLTRNLIYIPPSRDEKRPKLCYGVAIALGTMLSVLWGRAI